MKGVYSSPESILMEYSQQSLFPDTTYGLNSGGDPEMIPQLTYEAFVNFHKKYYHPSNAYIYFYGDDPEDDRFKLLSEYLDDYSNIESVEEIPLQKPFNEPIRKYMIMQFLRMRTLLNQCFPLTGFFQNQQI